MELGEWIVQRKSTRSYTGVPVEEELLRNLHTFLSTARPLDSSIRVRWEIEHLYGGA